MHHVQVTALRLFDEHGFDKVTIEQVARVAEVSQSTVYRYFSTKEGLVVYDEYDDQMLALMRHYLSQDLSLGQIVAAGISAMSGGHFEIDTATTRARLRLWFTVPSVRAAALLVVESRTEEIAAFMAGTGRWTLAQSRVICAAVVWAAIAAVRSWYESGADDNVAEYILQTLTQAYEAVSASQ